MPVPSDKAWRTLQSVVDWHKQNGQAVTSLVGEHRIKRPRKPRNGTQLTSMYLAQAPAGIVEPSSATEPASADCTIMAFDGTDLTTSSTTKTVYSMVPLVEDWIYEVKTIGNYYWAVPVDITLLAKADSTITAGSSGTVSVWSDSGTDTGENVTAYLDWINGGEDISSGKELIIQWFQLEASWRITQAECETVPSSIQEPASNITVGDPSGTKYFTDASGGAVTITLPAAFADAEYTIKKVDSSGNSVTVDTADSATIDGASTKVLSSQYDFIEVACDGTDWWIVGN